MSDTATHRESAALPKLNPSNDPTSRKDGWDPWRFLDLVIALTAGRCVRTELLRMPWWEEFLIELAVVVGVAYLLASARRWILNRFRASAD
jgi:hypothetical protein